MLNLLKRRPKIFIQLNLPQRLKYIKLKYGLNQSYPSIQCNIHKKI
jgi:hypothetical protein